ncbi:MAG: hypothetical protein ABJL99_09945 [Aliishimia sp.]
MHALSMNPRASANFSPAFSPHSLELLRPLLRSIAMWHRERTRLVPLDPEVARAQKYPLQQSHLEAAASRVCPVLDEDLLWRIAVHEAGHIVVAHTLGLPPAERATITNTGGFVDIPSPMLESAQSAKNRITALLGGRAAEQVVLGEALNGAGIGKNSDLELATQLAGQMICEWGLGDQLRYTPNLASNSEETSKVEKLLKAEEQRAIDVLQTEQKRTLHIARTLSKHRDVSKLTLKSLLDT